jgi:hypothetical protein
MTSVQILGLALGTVLLANATAVGVYLINSDDDAPAEDAVADVADDEVESEEAENDAAEADGEVPPVEFAGYSKTPYSEHYAISACEDEVDNKFSGKLVHKHVVDLSTRYDDYVEYFVVVVYAHLGSREDYSEVKIYCHVDPKTYALSYFKDYPA